MVKVAPNSNFVGRFSEKNLHSKIKGPLLPDLTNFYGFNFEKNANEFQSILQ